MTTLLPLLEEFYRDKLTLLLRHMERARVVAQYETNNTYQYLVNRDEAHLSWVASAIRGLGGTPPQDAPAPGPIAGGADAAHAALQDDARDAAAFVEKWRPRVEGVSNARHRGMLRVILGESLEQQRSFEQALAGRRDMLGRRGEQLGPSFGDVLPTRWIE